MMTFYIIILFPLFTVVIGAESCVGRENCENLESPFPITKIKPNFQFFCPPNEFIIGVRVSMEDGLEEARLQVICKPKPQPYEEIHCKDFATGYQINHVDHIGIVGLELQCAEGGEFVTVYDQTGHCIEKHVIPKVPKHCSLGYALCGIAYEKHFTENFQFSCCKLPTEYKTLTHPNTVLYDDETYEVIGPVIPINLTAVLNKPEPGVWSESFCMNGKYAYTLFAERETHLPEQFDVICGTREEILPSCPWLMNSVQVSLNDNGFINGIWVGCNDLSWIQVYTELGEDESGIMLRKYTCSKRNVVCGLIVFDSFTKNFKLLCCPYLEDDPEEDDPAVQLQTHVYYERLETGLNAIDVGLTKPRSDAKLDYTDFNLNQNPFVQLILKSIKNELKGETELLQDYKPKVIQIAEDSTTYQLVARSGQYEIRFEKFKMANSSGINYCDSLLNENIIDCKCYGGGEWREEYDELYCKDYWNPIAMVSDNELLQNIGGKSDFTSIQPYNRKDVIEIQLGVVERPPGYDSIQINVHDDFLKHERIQEYINPFTKLTCKNGIQLKSFDFSKRMVKERIEFIYGQLIIRFQYALGCLDGFQVNFEKFKDIVIDSKDEDKWRNIKDCRIPGHESVGIGSVGKYCKLG